MHLLPLVLIPLYALSDRFAGGGWPALDDKLPGRSVFWASLVLAGVGWLVGGPFGALAALAWFIYRTPAWGLFGGAIDAQTSRQKVGILLRHLLLAPLLALAAYWTGGDPIRVGIIASTYALGATALAVEFGEITAKQARDGKPEGDVNTFIELGRGALAGAALALSIILA